MGVGWGAGGRGFPEGCVHPAPRPQAVAAAQHARRRAEQERDDVATRVPRPPSPR